jgi:cell division protein ZipA
MNLPMMSELRWALLIVGVLFIAALAWWERRRPRQASGALDRARSREGGADAPPRLVRDPPLTLPEVRVREPVAVQQLPVVGTPHEEQPQQPEEPEMPVPEPAARTPAAEAAEPQREIDAAAFADDDTVDDLLAIVPADEIPADERATFDDSDSEPAAAPAAPMQREALPELQSAAPLRVDWPAEHERHILALRLVAPQRERFAGRSLRQALAAEGFLLGQFAIFHKPDDEHRAVLSAASLTRPGTFDMETMDSQHYGGLSLFAVLPGPRSPPQAFDELVFAARNLNDRLHGELQDEQGTPLTPARIAQLREQLRAGARS